MALSEEDPAASARDGGWRASLEIAGAAFLPGFLAGTQIAGLLFFLNPDLPFEPASVLRGVLYYGTLCGAGTLAALLPWTWSRRRRARRLLPWMLAAVFVFAAVLDGTHAAHLAYFLPPGINTRLIKATLWLTLAALITFYTALLHDLHRRPYGPRTRIGITLVALASVYVMLERREAFRPRPEPQPRPAAIEPEGRPRLWIVGLDAATLDVVLPLAEQGRLPFFADLLRRGAYARLGSLAPARPEAQWTTLATGVWPYKHGIVDRRIYPADFLAHGGRLRLLPAGLAFARWGTLGADPRPVSAADRRLPAVWEILARLGLGVGLIGWPASAPVPRDASFAFDDRFFHGDFGTPHAAPPELAERGVLFQLRPEDVEAALRGHLEREAPPAVLHALGGDLWRESLALFLVDQRSQPDFLGLVLPGLREVSQRDFGGYSAVQFDGAQDAADRVAAELVVAYYQQLDQFLAELWRRQAPPRILAVVSAYGTEAPGRWAQLWAALARRRPLEGSFREGPDGLMLLSGDGIRAGSFLADADLVDLVPTLLYGLGLPIARDLDGRVLTGAYRPSFLGAHPLTFVPSYEDVSLPATAAH